MTWNRNRTFSRLMGTLVLLACLTAVAACSGNNTAKEGTKASAETKVENKTIKFIPWNYYPNDTAAEGKKVLKAMSELAAEWEAKHPGAKIEFVKQPADDYSIWLNAQLIGDTAPDIVLHQGAAADGVSGLVVSLDPYLEKPNPYMDGNVKWIDTFYPGPLEILKQNGDGKNYAISPDQVETAVFYNKEIFEKAGVQPPTTWAEWIAAGQKIREAGFQPLGFGAGPLSWWGIGLVGDMIMSPTMAEQLDVLKPDGTIDNEEYARGIRKGIYGPKSPAYRDAWRVYKEWSGIWMDNWLTADAQNDFNTGKLAMLWTHSGAFPLIKDDPLRQFEFGTFYIPEITAETSEFAAGEQPKGVGGPSTPYAITRAAETRGNVELAVDWLQFITTPENASKYINEAGMFVPGIKNAEPNPELASMMQVLERGRPKVMMHAYILGETDKNVTSNAELFMLGKLDLDGFMSKIDDLYAKLPDEAAAQNKWDTGKW